MEGVVHTRFLASALAAAGILFLTLSAAQADRRVAFVVGNGAYKKVDMLPNPPIDAKAMASLLRNIGFDVVEGIDLGRDAMTARLRDFANKAQGADVAVFFYAGHGIAVNGKNYLIPVDADISTEMDVRLGAAIDVDVTLDQTMSDAKVKLVFLDACRNNPFADKIRSLTKTRNVVVSSGLVDMQAGEGTLIAFATSPGQSALDGPQGSNSPFTKALLANIATPGVEIQQAMTQVRAQVSDETHKSQLPWGHTNLTGVVFLNPTAVVASAGPANMTPSAAAASTEATEVELEFWRSIKDTKKPEELNAYLVKYPNGQFRTIALARLATLQTERSPAPAATPASAPSATGPIRTAEANAATEDALQLDKIKRRDIKRQLTALGFETAGDGPVFNDPTRKAIQRWQAARGYPTTSYFNDLQYAALMAETPPPATRAVETPRPQRQAAPQPAAPAPQRPAQAPGGNMNPAAAAAIGGIIGGAIGTSMGRRW
jgi:uncharacterized caspase-like protein